MLNSMGMESSVLMRLNIPAVLAAAALSAGVEVGIFAADIQRLLLVGPDHEPDIEPHDGAQPHADADGQILGTSGQPVGPWLRSSV